MSEQKEPKKEEEKPAEEKKEEKVDEKKEEKSELENGPIDNRDKSCGIDIEGKPYLYFMVPHPDWLNRTTCVEQCPNFTDYNDRPRSLNCNLNNMTNTCTEYCNPLDMAQGGWDPRTPIPFNKLFCIYNTTVVLERICFPGADVTKILKEMTEKMSSKLDLTTMTKWMDDLKNAWPVILGSFGIAFALAIVYMIFIRIFSGLIVWICILGYFVALLALGYSLYLKATAIRKFIDENETEADPNTEKNFETYQYLSYVVFGIAAISFLGLLSILNDIKLAIAIIKTATIYVTDTPTAMLVPPVSAVVNACWWAIWLVGFIFLYSIGEFYKSSKTVFGQVVHTQETEYRLWIYVFMGLWNNAFIQALNLFILASAPCIWYFSQGPGQSAHFAVIRSVYRAFRYHLGSLAFGSFLLALIQFIRLVLAYVKQQMKNTGQADNKVVKFIIECLECYMLCFQRFIEFLTRNAYIQIALTGKNFCSAAKDAMKMIFSNLARVALVSGLGAAFVLIGKLFIIIANVIICYKILTTYEPYIKTVSNAFLPCLLIIFIGYAVASIFMMVYEMGIDAILFCFLHDEEIAKAAGSGPPKFCPASLKDFFDEQEAKKKPATEEKKE